MDALPTGTVTLLFSDMEGSTQLLSRLGDRYIDALDAQRKILRQAWSDHDGVELGTEGDSFYVVFDTASHAVLAAVDAQRELAGFPWPEDRPVRIRIGMHTGAPVPHDGAYVGMDVHRAARIAAAAHGGQVALSSATAELVSEALPVDVALRDLGTHRLKDLPRDERVYQLVIDGVESEFPPLRSLGAASTLPLPQTRLLGREHDLASLSAVLSTGEARLVTLTGPGGTGKTSLALELARGQVDSFRDGVYFVPLAAVTDPPMMWGAIADVVNADPNNRHPRAVTTFLKDRRALLVLDNLEQLLGADEVAAQLLAAAPELALIATSRRPLHLSSEHEFAIQPLELPPESDVETVARSPAAQLFERQARRVRSSFRLTSDNSADVAELCRRLDGLPLAIELAAARSKLLTPRAIVARLESVLDLASSDRTRTTRQHNLRETMDWSYQLLEPPQQAFFRQLGVFAEGADLAAVTSVCTLPDELAADPIDMLLDIVDASLAQVSDTPDGEPRLSLLETVRSYALERLAEEDPGEFTHDRHALHYADVTEELVEQLRGQDHLSARARLAEDHANITAALGWLFGANTKDTTDLVRLKVGLRLVSQIGGNWAIGGRLSDAIFWTEQAIKHGGDRDSADVAHCMALLSNGLRFRGEHERSHELAMRSVEMLQRLGNQDHLPFALRTLAVSFWERDEIPETREQYEGAIAAARGTGNRYQLLRALSEMGSFESDQGDLGRCQQVEAEALALAIETNDPVSELGCRHNLACTLRLIGRAEEAEANLRALIAPALAIHEDAGDLNSIVEDYAAVLAELGSDDRSVALLMGAADGWHEQQGSPRSSIQENEIADAIDKARTRLPADEWRLAYRDGQDQGIDVVLATFVR